MSRVQLCQALRAPEPPPLLKLRFFSALHKEKGSVNPQVKRQIIANYRELLLLHGDGPEVGQWSREGQLFRFERLIQVADLTGCSVLDLGCGIGDLYSYLRERFGKLAYSGVDIVPEIIEFAAKRYPDAHFHCQDVTEQPLPQRYDYVLISGMFNNAVPDCTAFLQEMISAGYGMCDKGLAFNFISSYVNYVSPEMAYHQPAEVLEYVIRNLTHRVRMDHHYERCEVAVFAYR